MKYALDRLQVPVFYVSIIDNPNVPTNTVLTNSDDHFLKDYVTMGIVSKDSPMGQGTYIGLLRNELKIATTEEVLAALNKPHPHIGWDGPFYISHFFKPEGITKKMFYDILVRWKEITYAQIDVITKALKGIIL